MNLGLTKLKTMRAMSRETNCFVASVTIDGRVIGTVENDGQGGCHRYYWNDRDAGRALERWADTQPTEFEFERLDQLIDRIIERESVIKSVTATLRRWTKSSLVFRLPGDPAGSWRKVSPLNAGARTFLAQKYPNVVLIANDNLDVAISGDVDHQLATLGVRS